MISVAQQVANKSEGKKIAQFHDLVDPFLISHSYTTLIVVIGVLALVVLATFAWRYRVRHERFLRRLMNAYRAHDLTADAALQALSRFIRACQLPPDESLLRQLAAMRYSGQTVTESDLASLIKQCQQLIRLKRVS